MDDLWTNENYNKILKSGWLSAGPNSALTGQCNWTVRVMLHLRAL